MELHCGVIRRRPQLLHQQHVPVGPQGKKSPQEKTRVLAGPQAQEQAGQAFLQSRSRRPLIPRVSIKPTSVGVNLASRKAGLLALGAVVGGRRDWHREVPGAGPQARQ